MAKKILFLITEDWFFCSHFLERALAARVAGYDVVVASRERTHAAIIRKLGLSFIAIEFNRRSINPVKELLILAKIFSIYRLEKPDIVHQVAAKPILYGSLVARLCFGKRIILVNAPVGMGYIFSSTDYTARFLRPLLRLAYRFLLNPERSRVIFENKDDLAEFIGQKAVRITDAILIRGAGVDLKKFMPSPLLQNEKKLPVVMFTARMLKDKGVYEFVAAAHQLYAEKITARFILVGAPDLLNPTSVSLQTLKKWHGHKNIEWWGWREDISIPLKEATIACLPSYREGLPKALIEAAACGLPIVTTDTVGCREVVINGVNGFLVPVRNSNALAQALRKLLLDTELCLKMGQKSRWLAEKNFSSAQVIRETLGVYATLICKE